MKEFINDEITELEKQADTAWDKYNNLRKEITEKKNELVGLSQWKGKFIKYHDEFFEHTVYMKVDDVMRDKVRHTDKDFSYVLRGIGFEGELTGYQDETWFEWGLWHELYLCGDEEQFIKQIDYIHEIDEKEFNKKFDEFIEGAKKQHYNFLNLKKKSL